jgi:uncharacterized protein (TIGR02231 family)
MTMRKLTMSLATLLFAVSSMAARPPPIRRVVVFADRAEVTRTGELVCEAGRAEALFPGLPAAMDSRTLRGIVSGKATVIGVTSRVRARDSEQAVERDSPAAALKLEILTKRDAIDDLVAEERNLEEQNHLLAAYDDYLRSIVGEEMRNTKPDTKVWTQALDTVRDRRLAAAIRVGELETKVRVTRRELQVLEMRLQSLGAATTPDVIDASVTVDCNGESRVEVSLAYVLPGATWRPDYDLRFTTAKESKAGVGVAVLMISAVVSQSTGENWDNVLLSLSTSKPRLGTEAPYPAPLYVSGYVTQNGKVLLQATERREALVGGGVTRAPGPQQAELQDQGQSFALTLPRPVTVKADGRPYWMPIDQVSTAAEARLVAVPKLRPYVYQVAQLKNQASYALLSGVLHTYRRGAYVGDSDLTYKAPGERIEASLGVDDELKVVRAPIEEKDKEGGIVSNQKLNRAYRITVTNNAKSTEVVEVRENIPVSKIDDVSVEILKDGTTAGFQLDSHQGFVSWKLQLSPGEKKSVDLRFKISVPSDWVVGG